jgi:hypothetical protein
MYLLELVQQANSGRSTKWTESRLTNNNNNNNQFFIYLCAELNSRWPITESARKTNTTNKTHIMKTRQGKSNKNKYDNNNNDNTNTNNDNNNNKNNNFINTGLSYY